MKILSVSRASDTLTSGVPVPVTDVPRASVPEDIVVTIAHGDGTQGVYNVRSKADLAKQVAQYLQWQSDFNELQKMSGGEFSL